MQAQTLATKGELIVEVLGKIASRTVKEITPFGVRVEMNYEGQATGKYNANVLSTINALLKTDGTSEWENKAIHTTPEGELIAVIGSGTGRATGPTRTTEGEVVFMTQSPRLSWLNNTRGRVESTANVATSTYHARIYAKK